MRWNLPMQIGDKEPCSKIIKSKNWMTIISKQNQMIEEVKGERDAAVAEIGDLKNKLATDVSSLRNRLPVALHVNYESRTEALLTYEVVFQSGQPISMDDHNYGVVAVGPKCYVDFSDDIFWVGMGAVDIQGVGLIEEALALEDVYDLMTRIPTMTRILAAAVWYAWLGLVMWVFRILPDISRHKL